MSCWLLVCMLTVYVFAVIYKNWLGLKFCGALASWVWEGHIRVFALPFGGFLPEALSDLIESKPMIMLSIRRWKTGVCSHCEAKQWKKLLLFRKPLLPPNHFHSHMSLKTADLWEKLPNNPWKQLGGEISEQWYQDRKAKKIIVLHPGMEIVRWVFS